MGKYLPVIVTAECGSLTRAAQSLGYTQPSLGYIISNLEEEVGAKLFFRSQRGMKLTEAGKRLVPLMKKIDAMEAALQKEAQLSQVESLRVGAIPCVMGQWLPKVLLDFCQEHPGATVQLQQQNSDLEAEVKVKEHALDCAFFGGACPAGLESIPLYEDPYYLVVGADSPLWEEKEVSIEEAAGKYPFIPTLESTWEESVAGELYKQVNRHERIDVSPQENRVAVAMVESGLGVAILSGLELTDLGAHRRVRAIPLAERPVRTISFLRPKGAECLSLAMDFFRLTQARLAAWEEAAAAAR